MTCINPGDLVVLKSGSPVMTVSHLSGGQNAFVTAKWFSEVKQEFAQEVLHVQQVKVVIQPS